MDASTPDVSVSCRIIRQCVKGCHFTSRLCCFDGTVRSRKESRGDCLVTDYGEAREGTVCNGKGDVVEEEAGRQFLWRGVQYEEASI